MRSRANSRDAQLRSQLAREAARVMIDGGIRDYSLAKRKALDRLRLPAGTPLPANREIEEAVSEHQRLFGGSERLDRLQQMRAVAIEAMRALAGFKPRLVGPVLSGTADENSTVSLHLFADAVEEVGWDLIDRGIPYRETEQRLRMSSGSFERIPCYAFLAGGTPVELLVFAGRMRRQTPLSPIDGRAMPRASLAEVEALADGDSAPALP